MTALELKIVFESELKDLYSKEETRSIFDYVLSEITGIAKVGIISQLSFQIDSKTEQHIYSIIEKLKKYTPVQYIFGNAHFYGLEFEVNPNVLIPRPETEELVDWIISDNKGKTLKILDIGTGCGCIALALKKNLPKCSVAAIDISRQALEVAKKNAVSLGLDVEFKEVDIIKLSNHQTNPEGFDIIVANPPYIKASDKNFVGKNVLDFEPHLALFVPDENPLIFYEAIADYANRMKGVTIYFEIHENAGDDVNALLKNMGFTDILARKDLSGKERMVRCRNA